MDLDTTPCPTPGPLYLLILCFQCGVKMVLEVTAASLSSETMVRRKSG